MSKILVTGASGHLGRNTLQTLRPQRLHRLPQPNSQTQVSTTTTGHRAKSTSQRVGGTRKCQAGRRGTA
jgi:uncharacterized protein YbjT (DUF2867 family)